MASTTTKPAATEPTPAELKREAQKQLAEAVKSARQEYGTTVADAKVVRDEAIAEAYATFAKATAAAGE